MVKQLAYILILLLPLSTLGEEVICYDETLEFFECVKKVKKLVSDRQYDKVVQIFDEQNKDTATKLFNGSSLLRSRLINDVRSGYLKEDKVQNARQHIKDLKGLIRSSSFIGKNYEQDINEVVNEVDIRLDIQFGEKEEVYEAIKRLKNLDFRYGTPGVLKDLGQRAAKYKDPDLLRLYVENVHDRDITYALVYDYFSYGDQEAIHFLKNNGIDIISGCSNCSSSILCEYMAEITETAEEPLSEDEIEDYIEFFHSLTSEDQRESIKCYKSTLSEALADFREMHLERLEEFRSYEKEELGPSPVKRVSLNSADSIILKKENRHLIVHRQYSKECRSNEVKSYFETWAYNHSLRIFNRAILSEDQNYIFVEQRGSCLMKLEMQPLLTPFVGESSLELDEFFSSGWPL